jgi:hypothetical protein
MYTYIYTYVCTYIANLNQPTGRKFGRIYWRYLFIAILTMLKFKADTTFLKQIYFLLTYTNTLAYYQVYVVIVNAHSIKSFSKILKIKNNFIIIIKTCPFIQLFS